VATPQRTLTASLTFRRTPSRERKPQLYARAGIRHFWRVEDVSGKIALYAYELDPATQTYAVTGIYHGRVQLDLPFEIDIDLTEINQL
jgi:hypothetical protein